MNILCNNGVGTLSWEKEENCLEQNQDFLYTVSYVQLPKAVSVSFPGDLGGKAPTVLTSTCVSTDQSIKTKKDSPSVSKPTKCGLTQAMVVTTDRSCPLRWRPEHVHTLPARAGVEYRGLLCPPSSAGVFMSLFKKLLRNVMWWDKAS